MFYKKSSFLLLFVLLLNACTVPPIKPPIYNQTELLDKIIQENPYACQIKSKGVFILENRFHKSKFKGYINKACDNNFHLNILGLFNQVAYRAVFKDGNLQVYKSDKNVSKEFPMILSNEDVYKMASLLNIPAVVPTAEFDFRVTEENRYLMSKEGVDIFVNGETFKIEEVSQKNGILKYTYDGNRLKELHFIDFSVNIRITFF